MQSSGEALSNVVIDEDPKIPAWNSANQDGEKMPTFDDDSKKKVLRLIEIFFMLFSIGQEGEEEGNQARRRSQGGLNFFELNSLNAAEQSAATQE